MARVGQALRAANVRAIYLLHGTFVGGDAIGLYAQLSRFLPGLGQTIHRLTKQAVDAVAKDGGNYTQEFADIFSQSINPPGVAPIPVELFTWTSENHHIGRADGAVRLIAELAERPTPESGRILLWGHSHAGNVFALVTQLLACRREFRQRFFHAARSFYRGFLSNKCAIPIWGAVESLFTDQPRPLADARLDFVTFGTPLRYGWQQGGYAKLLHFVHHHPRTDLPQYRSVFPPSVDDMLTARDGDYVQLLGIAGSNLSPGLLSPRAWVADVRLSRLLEDGLPRETLLTRWSAGRRAPDIGETLLVAYPHSRETILQHALGHNVYTRLKWLLFHAEVTAERFYKLPPIE